MSNHKPENTFIYRCTVATGVLLIFTAIVHVLNINETLVAIKTGDIAADYAPDTAGMWIFSGLSMFMLGIWLLFLSGDLKRRQRKAWWQAILIGVALMTFGAGCWWQYPKALYFLYFVLLGLLLIIPCIVYSRNFFSRRFADSI